MVTRSIRFDDEVFATLMSESDERNVSFQWLVHKLIEEGLVRLADAKEFKVTA